MSGYVLAGYAVTIATLVTYAVVLVRRARTLSGLAESRRRMSEDKP